MAEVSTVIAGTLDPEELYRILPERVMAKLGLNDFCIMLYSRETKRLVAKSVSVGDGRTMPEFTLAPGEGVAGKVFATGEPAWIPDVRSSPDFLHYGGRRTDVRSFMCVPLVSKGKNIGVLMLNHPEPNAFEPELLPTMRVLASYLAIAIENAEMFGLVKSLAEKDSLTLLYNHGAFHEKLAIELERANRYVRPMAVIMLDLDNFKEINDRYGHTTGDRVLALVAGALGAHLRKTDIAARYGGDEFAVILPETDLSSAAVIAERIAEGISNVRLDIGEEASSPSPRASGTPPARHDAPGRGEILNTADRLMYDSKRRGPGGVLGMQIYVRSPGRSGKEWVNRLDNLLAKFGLVSDDVPTTEELTWLKESRERVGMIIRARWVILAILAGYAIYVILLLPHRGDRCPTGHDVAPCRRPSPHFSSRSPTTRGTSTATAGSAGSGT